MRRINPTGFYTWWIFGQIKNDFFILGESGTGSLPADTVGTILSYDIA
jgi:hypothetical protein